MRGGISVTGRSSCTLRDRRQCVTCSLCLRPGRFGACREAVAFLRDIRELRVGSAKIRIRLLSIKLRLLGCGAKLGELRLSFSHTVGDDRVT